MPSIVRRVRYSCDTCQREIDLKENVYGVDVASRCIITSGCRGKMYRMPSVRDKSNKDRPATIPGLEEWSQRKVLFTFEQSIKSNLWTVKHNLGIKPVVQVFVVRSLSPTETTLVELDADQYTITIVDSNTLTISFPAAESGTVQCITLTSARNLPPNVVLETTVPPVQLTSESTLTIATRRSDPQITFDLIFNNEDQTIVTYTDVDDSPTILSPWVSANRIFVNGKAYTVRSFNVVAYDATVQTSFNSGLVQSNTSFYFDFGTPYNRAEENLILMALPPFAPADRIYDRVIDLNDIDTVQPQLVFSNAEVFTLETTPSSVFPYIKTVR